MANSRNKCWKTIAKGFENNIEELYSLYLETKSLRKLSVLTGLDRKLLAHIFKIYNKENIIEIRKNKINFKYFENIDNQYKAYYLGLIYADGNICKTKFSIGLVEKDFYILEPLVRQLNLQNKISIRTFENKQTMNIIQFTNKDFSKDLINKGVVERKSLILTFPDEKILPLNLIKHFIRGYFDGDGCNYINQTNTSQRLEFLGTFEFLSRINEIFSISAGSNLQTIFKRKNIYSLRFSKIKDIISILNWLEEGSFIKLNRKYKRMNKEVSNEQV